MQSLAFKREEDCQYSQSFSPLKPNKCNSIFFLPNIGRRWTGNSTVCYEPFCNRKMFDIQGSVNEN